MWSCGEVATRSQANSRVWFHMKLGESQHPHWKQYVCSTDSAMPSLGILMAVWDSQLPQFQIWAVSITARNKQSTSPLQVHVHCKRAPAYPAVVKLLFTQWQTYSKSLRFRGCCLWMLRMPSTPWIGELHFTTFPMSVQPLLPCWKTATRHQVTRWRWNTITRGCNARRSAWDGHVCRLSHPSYAQVEWHLWILLSDLVCA